MSAAELQTYCGRHARLYTAVSARGYNRQGRISDRRFAVAKASDEFSSVAAVYDRRQRAEARPSELGVERWKTNSSIATGLPASPKRCEGGWPVPSGDFLCRASGSDAILFLASSSERPIHQCGPQGRGYSKTVGAAVSAAELQTYCGRHARLYTAVSARGHNKTFIRPTGPWLQ